MITSSYAQLKGISGSGKGTRVEQLLRFLLSKNYNYQIYHTEFKNKKCPIAIEFPDLNIFITGKYALGRASKLHSWTGLDYLNTGFGAWFVYWLIKKFSNKNFICEGYPLTLSPVYNLDSIHNKFGYNNVFYQYFFYDKRESMIDRCFNRNGGKIIKGTCWGTETATKNNYQYNKNLSKELKSPTLNKCEVHTQKFDDPVYVFGYNYLKFLGLGELADKFVSYCNNNSNLRINGQTQDLSLVEGIINNNLEMSKFIPFNNEACEQFYESIK
jgi:hypothetical protein